jgi:gluconolactonase
MQKVSTLFLPVFLVFLSPGTYGYQKENVASEHGKHFKVLPAATELLPYKAAYFNLQDSGGLIADGAKLQLVSDQFSFTEGPAVDKKGNVFFTDQPNDKIWKWDTDGKLTVFLEKSGRSNGLYFDKKGNLLACADENNQLWSISPDKKITVLVKDLKGRKLNGPNDLWADGKGGIYITDPYYQRPYWTRQSPDLEEQKVYYLPKGKKELVAVAAGFKRPNGIVGTPDGKYLYVADIGDSRTYKFVIQKDGALTGRQLFTEQGSDGMTLDNKGNVYLTGDGVTVYDPQGKRTEHISVPAKWTANVCFGGKKRNKLFITASEAVYLLDMKVKGVE